MSTVPTSTVQTRTVPRNTVRKDSPSSADAVIDRYPALTAHLICESRGYFTPRAAANAILAHRQDRAFYCEWYIDAGKWNEQEILRFGRRVLANAFARRRSHRGYMAEYARARALVERERQGAPPSMFSSWQ